MNWETTYEHWGSQPFAGYVIATCLHDGKPHSIVLLEEDDLVFELEPDVPLATAIFYFQQVLAVQQSAYQRGVSAARDVMQQEMRRLMGIDKPEVCR